MFPFRLGGQAPPGPLRKGHGIVPADLHHRVIVVIGIGPVGSVRHTPVGTIDHAPPLAAHHAPCRRGIRGQEAEKDEGIAEAFGLGHVAGIGHEAGEARIGDGGGIHQERPQLLAARGAFAIHRQAGPGGAHQRAAPRNGQGRSTPVPVAPGACSGDGGRGRGWRGGGRAAPGRGTAGFCLGLAHVASIVGGVQVMARFRGEVQNDLFDIAAVPAIALGHQTEDPRA